MRSTFSIDEIIQMFETRGRRWYGGERINQLQHALQAATHAEQAGASDAMVVAALLHDFGHMVDESYDANIDDRHEQIAAEMLFGLLPNAVVEPIRLHVDAKRYLCFAKPGYLDGLSESSRKSLEVQGQPFDERGARVFLGKPYAQEALQLRRWDDLAKDPKVNTPTLEHFLARVDRVLRN